jgi:hypothetical protein
MDTWGLDPTDYRFHTSLMRRYPSPLSRYTFGSSFPKQKKVFIEKKKPYSFSTLIVTEGIRFCLFLAIHSGTSIIEFRLSTCE